MPLYSNFNSIHGVEDYLQALLYCRKFPYEHAIDEIWLIFADAIV